MASVTNRFPLWGDTGEAPQSGFLYAGGDQVNEKHLNYLWDKVQKQTDDFITKTDDLQTQIDDIDANGDGIVDEADTTNLYKNNDIDTNGDGKVNSAETADSLTGNNVTTVNGNTGDVTVQGTPSGGIIMWSGTTSDVPSGWTLCDGTDGTPDLRNRFIAGAGGQYSAGSTGGADSVQLSESEMPSHDHTGGTSTDGNHSHGYSRTDGTTTFSTSGEGVSDNEANNLDYESLNTSSAGSHNHSLSINNAGGDEAHENRPPFYALAFIMKV